MSVFWVIAILLLALTIGILLLPLLRGRAVQTLRADHDLAVYVDQLKELENDLARGLMSPDQADAARREIERRILKTSDKNEAQPDKPFGADRLAIAVGGLVPILAVLLYLELGRPGLSGHIPQTASGADVAQQAPEMSAMIERLVESLKNQPEDPRRWDLLGRSFMTLDRYEEAVDAFTNAYDRLQGPDKSDVGIRLGEALVQADGGVVPLRAEPLFRDGMKDHPYDPKPRFYIATMKAQAGNIKGALQDFIDMKAIGPADAPWMATVRQMIEQAAGDAGIDPSQVSPRPQAVALAQRREAASAPSPGPSSEQVEAAQQMSAEERQEMIRSMVARLAARLENEPSDLDGWRRLAMAYRVLGETEKAEQAEARIRALTGE